MSNSVLEKIFSIKNLDNHKIIRILGIKIKIRPFTKKSNGHNQIEAYFLSVHKHLDIIAQDLLIASKFVRTHNICLKTDYPVALESDDHKFPFGTKQDDTRHPRFIRKCESLFSVDRDIKFLDLGCSGGGMVLDACLRGHIGIGLEGSDFSYLNQRAEWRVLHNNLFTCDISKDFTLCDKTSSEIVKFEVITAWEVLEHLTEDELKQLFINIKKHLTDDGYFIGSVSTVDSFYPGTSINLHKTVKPREWWLEKIKEYGFEDISETFVLNDYARGSGNPSVSWWSMGEYEKMEAEVSFHLVLKKAK